VIFHNDVKNVRNEFKNLLKQEMFVPDKTGVKTLEIVNASFIANEPAIFGTPNIEYITRELQWYKSMSLNVNDIPGGTPEIWQQVATPSGRINSNYGWCIYSEDNYDQFLDVVNELLKNPNSRRAVMIYTRPSMHFEFNQDGMSDFICTNTVQYLIRNGFVNAIVQMRSNDAVYGYKNDFAWQQYVLAEVVDTLNTPGNNYKIGTIFWNVASLHVYERHFKFVL
jgi:thymidylate synthase